MQTLSVLMPVYNEARTLRTIIDRVMKAPIDLDIELVAVDDGSSDDSLAILNEVAASDSRIKVVSQPKNLGKGRAIRTAIENMTGDLAIIQDADLEYDPDQYPVVLKPLLDGRADAVYGSRFASSPERRVLFYWHSMGNKLLTALSNMANDLNLTDMETCYKAVRGDLLKRLRLTSDRFGIEPEITSRLAGAGARIYEVPISYHGRTYAEGKTIGWRDGLQALWLIFKFRFLDTQFTTDAGHSTLENMATSPNVARWTLEQFEPHIGDRVLEAGAGIGNLTTCLLDRKLLCAVDIDPLHVEAVSKRFGHLENVFVRQGDLEDHAFADAITDRFDTVVCVNVLEHLERPEAALGAFFRLLDNGGHALVLVPAHDWLFSDADTALGHHKRYRAPMLRRLIEDQGFDVLEVREFNRLGVVGWWFNRLVGKTTVGRFQMRLFGWLLPLARLVERLNFLPGLSLVAIARKP